MDLEDTEARIGEGQYQFDRLTQPTKSERQTEKYIHDSSMTQIHE
jgi:hypothetical protein